ncbi:MAG: NUDIX domain-containing protein [Candidatus Coprovivens sp.]
MEMLDIFDKDHNYLGTCEKKEVHQKGLWHQVFACLLIDGEKNKVYLQYKNSGHNDVSNLNKIDISVGGHLSAGETIEDGIREIEEETGLKVAYKDLIPVGMRLIDKLINENYIIREFSYLHIYDSEFDLNTLKSQDDEVLYFIEFDIDELIAYFTNETDKISGLTPEGYKEFKKEDFIQAYIGDDRLYLKYLLLAKQVINKEQNISWQNFH